MRFLLTVSCKNHVISLLLSAVALILMPLKILVMNFCFGKVSGYDNMFSWAGESLPYTCVKLSSFPRLKSTPWFSYFVRESAVSLAESLWILGERPVCRWLPQQQQLPYQPQVLAEGLWIEWGVHCSAAETQEIQHWLGWKDSKSNSLSRGISIFDQRHTGKELPGCGIACLEGNTKVTFFSLQIEV